MSHEEEDFDALSHEDEEQEKSSRRKRRDIDDEAEEADSDEEDGDADLDEDEDEEEEEDDDEEVARPRKKARTTDLLDLEAEASDEDEDAEGPEFDPEELRDFVVDEGEEDEDIDESANIHRRLDRNRDKETEQIVRRLQERHANYAQTLDMDQDDFERSKLRQQARQPTLKDPRLFSVKVKPGMERELCTQLLNKFFHMQQQNENLKIYSVVAMDHLKGYIYVEADKLDTARDFVMYINGIYATKIQLVKLNEMVPTLTITKKKATLKRGDWVRVKRGVYANDLAQVVEYDPSNEKVTVKLVPRLDLEAYKNRGVMDKPAEEEEGKEKDGKGTKRKRTNLVKTARPPQRLFNPDDVKELGGTESIRDERTGELYEVFDRNRYREGYLYRDMKLTMLIVDPPPPDLIELQRFQAVLPRTAGGLDGGDEEAEIGPEGITAQMKIANEIAKRRQVHFQRDDKVLVVEGELKNLVGRVVDVRENEVRVQPLYDVQNEQPLSLPVIPLAPQQLRKHFSNGAHVKVIAGAHNGETGIVVKISDNVATLISDVSMSELRVLTSDLVATAEISTGAKIGDYSLYDMVHVSATEVGVIVRIEGDNAVILDPNGATRDYKLQALQRRRDTRSVVAKGNDGKPVGAGDKVRILTGPYKNQTGLVKHVYRANCYVYIKDRPQNSGLVVVRAKSLVVAGEPINNQRRDVFGKVITAVAPRANTKGRGRHNDRFLHRHVRITRGPWKNYQGLVKDATDHDVTVELQSNAKRVTISKDYVIDLEEERLANATQYPEFAQDVTKTPLRGDQTPLRIGTPGRPMTPSHDPFNPLAMPTPVGFDRRTPAPTTPAAVPYHTPAPTTPASMPYHTPVPATPAPFTPATPNAVPFTPAVPLSTPLPRSMPTPMSAPTPAPSTPGPLPPRTPQQPISYSTPLPYSPAPGTPGSVHGYVETPKTPTEMPYGYTPATFVGTPVTPNTQSLTTPMTALPATPGSQYQEPATPFGVSGDQEPENDTLHLFEKVLVKIDGAYRSNLADKVAVVREAQGDTIVAVLVDTSEELSVPISMLSVVTPEKRDSVMIVRGQFAGQRGMLIGIDMPDGIVKMDQTGEIKILKLSSLAKYQK